MRSLWIGRTGLSAGQLQADIHSNNIANINTVGFKAKDALFAETMHHQVVRSNRATALVPGGSESVALGGGAVVVGTLVDQRSGDVEVTEKEWHLALAGEGFFPIGWELAPGGVAFTRNGAFGLDGENRVVDFEGYPLLDDRGLAVEVPKGTKEVVIHADGRVMRVDDADMEHVLARLHIARFNNSSGLEHLGGGRYGVTGASGEPQWVQPKDGLVAIRQGALERSNVDLATEMVGLMTAQRALQLSARVVQVADEMMGIANRIYR